MTKRYRVPQALSNEIGNVGCQIKKLQTLLQKFQIDFFRNCTKNCPFKARHAKKKLKGSKTRMRFGYEDCSEDCNMKKRHEEICTQLEKLSDTLWHIV